MSDESTGLPPPAPAPAPTPTFVPADEFKTFQATLAGTLETLQQSLQGIQAALATRPEPAPAAPPAAAISQEQFKQAITEGNAAIIEAYLEQQRRQDREVLETRLGQLEATGAQGFETVHRRTLEALPHYKRFHKEIDGYVAHLPPLAKANPKTFEIAYQAVIGAHADELIAEATEAAVRKAREPEPAAIPGTSAPGRGTATSPVPSAKELFGEDAALALQAVGRDEEAFAKRLGYKSWAAYVALYQKQLEEATARG